MDRTRASEMPRLNNTLFKTSRFDILPIKCFGNLMKRNNVQIWDLIMDDLVHQVKMKNQQSNDVDIKTHAYWAHSSAWQPHTKWSKCLNTGNICSWKVIATTITIVYLVGSSESCRDVKRNNRSNKTLVLTSYCKKLPYFHSATPRYISISN